MSPPLDSGQIRRALGLPAGAGAARRYDSVAIDSRRVDAGALFVALPGERHDGFDFLTEAALRGARGALVPAGRPTPDLDLEWFPVGDTREGLARLAAWYRSRSGARVVGVTGSSGKTTVKEMLAAALGGAGRAVHRTQGNLNSQVGLPLSILAAPRGADLWVLELGTSRPGEIGRLAEVAGPDDAVVTTVGSAHLEAFGTVDAVLREKLALVRAAREGGAVVVGERPGALAREARRLRPDTLVAGMGEGADWRPDRHEVGAERVRFERQGVVYRVEAGGEHHLRDALLAAAMADRLGVDPRAAARGLADFRPVGMRGSLRRAGRLLLMADCYNANPESFEAAVRHCADAFPGRRRVAAVGSMLELGEGSGKAHLEAARRLVEAGFSTVVATGAFVEAFRHLGGEAAATRVVPAEGAEEAARRLEGLLEGNELVLVKGSRGARLEVVVHHLERRFGGNGRREREAIGGSGEGEDHGPGGETG